MTDIDPRIRRKRPSLRLIVSSATIDATSFLEYFTSGTSEDEVAIASLEGRMYPVELAYLQEPTADYVRKAAETVYNIHLQVRPASLVATLSHLVSAKPRRYSSISNRSGRNRPVSRGARRFDCRVRLSRYLWPNLTSCLVYLVIPNGLCH